MIASALASLLLVAISDTTAPATGPSMRARLSDDAIRQAVRETLAEQPSTASTGHGRVLSGERSTSFSRQMDEARVPSCWRPDALKHQPAAIGPIGIGGALALPFWAAAIVRGKCNP